MNLLTKWWHEMLSRPRLRFYDFNLRRFDRTAECKQEIWANAHETRESL